jgi:hypothetical protein
MNGIEDCQRPNRILRRIVSTTGENCIDRPMNRLIERNPPVKASANLCQVGIARINEIGPRLEITRIRRRPTVNNAGMSGRDKIGFVAARRRLEDEPLQRLGELVEADCILD